jgi:glycogen operon protein
LKRFGNALELFPLTPTLSDPTLGALGLENEWGYMPWSLLALNGNYFKEKDPLKQIKILQNTLAACKQDGLNVIVDLVPFHTHVSTCPEVGLYALRPDYYLRHNGAYKDITGCGNTLNINDPHTKALILWQSELWAQRYGAAIRYDQAAVAFTKVTIDQSTGAMDVQFDPNNPFAKLLLSRHSIIEPGHGWGIFSRKVQLPGIREKNFSMRDLIGGRPTADAGGNLRDLAFILSNFVGPHPTQTNNPWRANRGITVYPHDGMCPFDTAQRRAAVLVAMKCKANPDIKQTYLNWAKSTSSDDRAHLVSAIHTAVQRDLPEDLFTLSAAVHRYYMGLLYLTPGPILSVFGDQRVRTQRGDPDGYNRREFITDLGWSREPEQRPQTLQEEMERTEAVVDELYSFRQRYAAHFKNTHIIDGVAPSGFDGTVTPALTWYGKDGREIAQGIWNKGNGHARGFLGQMVTLNRSGQEADAIFMAFRETLGGHFRLPPLPEGKQMWRRCLETSARHQSMQSDNFLPGATYHCGRSPRVVVFEAVSLESQLG